MSEKNTEEIVSVDETSEKSSHWTINIPKPKLPKLTPKKIAIGAGIAATAALGVIFLGKSYDPGFDRDDDWSEDSDELVKDEVFESSEDAPSED